MKRQSKGQMGKRILNYFRSRRFKARFLPTNGQAVRIGINQWNFIVGITGMQLNATEIRYIAQGDILLTSVKDAQKIVLAYDELFR